MSVGPELEEGLSRRSRKTAQLWDKLLWWIRQGHYSPVWPWVSQGLTRVPAPAPDPLFHRILNLRPGLGSSVLELIVVSVG